MTTLYVKDLCERAETSLHSQSLSQLSPQEGLQAYRFFLNKEEERIRLLHKSGANGLCLTECRAALFDLILQTLFEVAQQKLDRFPEIALVANGGYGRSTLNPHSDLDLLFLLNQHSRKLSTSQTKFVNDILYPLWDMGLKVGYATRSIDECLKEAKTNPMTRTTLFDARHIAGDLKLFKTFQKRYRQVAILQDLPIFLKEREEDMQRRYEKYSHTVFLQEPHLKDSPGGLRDFHNLLWITDAKLGTRELALFVEKGILDNEAITQLHEALVFLLRVRNELHYCTDRANDVLTLRLQGEVADAFQYPQSTILSRIEVFMRDYYRHARSIRDNTMMIMETFSLEPIRQKGALRSLLASTIFRPKVFDGFTAENGFIFPQDDHVFDEDSTRLLRLFSHCQQQNLRLSPEIRKLIKANYSQINHAFRSLQANRDQFRDILERKGQVANALQQMHRIGFLGRYIPEFGQLDCLVQHEFFHRYTADEHTLRCIDELDSLFDDPLPERDIYRKLFLDHSDPYSLYLALLMHDTGRSEDFREHTDGSVLLTMRVSKRLHIHGSRLKLLNFLVDNHLTFWSFATKRNLEDPQVIQEFAKIVKNRTNLDSILLLTYADSRGTNEGGWSSWKESLILQLYRHTVTYLETDPESYHQQVKDNIATLKVDTLKLLSAKYHAQAELHFQGMPAAYFQFREAQSIGTHIRAADQYLNRKRNAKDDSFHCAIQWIERPERGFTDFIIATSDQPRLIQKICCALASEQMTILSADIYTRSDDLVLDVFRVQTTMGTAVKKRSPQIRVIEKLYELCQSNHYDPTTCFQKKANFLNPESEGHHPFPVRAFLNNHLDLRYTVVEIQAIDRIGLLHDILDRLYEYSCPIFQARICTEKGAALDTLYITDANHQKIQDSDLIEKITKDLEEILTPS